MTTEQSSDTSDSGVLSEPPADLLYPIPDELRTLPTEVVGVPPEPLATALPFHLLSPEDFERVCLVVVEQIDAIREARMYGVRGQKDYGIDIVARDHEDDHVLYQVRRYQVFGSDDLREAVNGFVADRRFSPKRFVVCVASPVMETDRREMVDELEVLRETNDFDIDLYDGRQLTKRLIRHPQLVRRFFGEGWVEAMASGTEPVPSAPPERDVLAQAVLRGPLKALNLEAKLTSAEESGVEPDRAAVILGEVAGELEERGFRSVASELRVKQAGLVEQSGDPSSAAMLLATVVWEHARLGQVQLAHAARRALDRLNLTDAEGGWVSFREAVDAIVAWYEGGDDDLTEVFDLAKELVNTNHPFASRVLLWTAESAIAVRDTRGFEQAKGTLQRFLVEHVATDDQRVEEITLGLRCCLADHTGDWQNLDRMARGGELGHKLAALTLARIARWYALNRKADEATLYYRQAIDQACQAECFGDAADLVLAWMRVELQYGPTDETFDRQRLASALREAGPGRLADWTRSNEFVQDALLDERPREALRYSRQVLREAVIVGRLEHERQAESLIAQSLQRAKRPSQALIHFVRAGEHKAVQQVDDLTAAPTEELMTLMTFGLPSSRASALTAAAAVSDYVLDENVTRIAALALEATQDFAQSLFSPLIWIEAWTALAAFSKRLDQGLSIRALDLLEPLVDRNEGSYRHNDDQHVDVVAGIHVAHPELRERTTAHLVRLLAQGSELSKRVQQLSHAIVDIEDGGFRGAVEELARTGDVSSQRLLAAHGIENESLREMATTRVEAAIEAPGRMPGHFSFGTGFIEVSMLARQVSLELRAAFAARMMRQAEDIGDLEVNRCDAAYAIHNVADALSNELRAELFERMIAIASGEHGVEGEASSIIGTGNDPLSPMQFNLSLGELQPAALRAAAVLAQGLDEQQLVAHLATPLLHALPERDANDVAHAIRALPPEAHELDVDSLSRMSSVWARQLAVVIWVGRSAEYPEVVGNRLLVDRDVRVRRTLAAGLNRLAASNPTIAADFAEKLSTDSAWSVRAAASMGHT